MKNNESRKLAERLKKATDDEIESQLIEWDVWEKGDASPVTDANATFRLIGNMARLKKKYLSIGTPFGTELSVGFGNWETMLDSSIDFPRKICEQAIFELETNKVALQEKERIVKTHSRIGTRLWWIFLFLVVVLGIFILTRV